LIDKLFTRTFPDKLLRLVLATALSITYFIFFDIS